MTREKTNRGWLGPHITHGLLFALALLGGAPCCGAAPVQTLRCRDIPSSLSFSPDGSLLAVAELGDGGKPAQVEVWSVRTSRVVHTLPYPNNVDSVAFSPQGHLLAAGSDEGGVVLWDTGAWRRIADLPGTASCSALAFSPDGTLLATAPDSKSIHLWRVSTHQLLRRLPWPGETKWAIWSLAFSPDAKTVAAGAGESGYVRLWDTATGRIRRTIQADEPAVNSVAFSPNGRLLATGSLDGSAKMWDIHRWRVVHRVQAGSRSFVFTVAFSPNGRWLGVVCGEPASEALLVSVATGRRVRAYRPGQRKTMYDLAFSPDGRLLATTYTSPTDATAANTISLWSVPQK